MAKVIILRNGEAVEVDSESVHPTPTEADLQARLSQWRSSATISRRQGKQQLIIDGLDDAVETAIANVADTKQRKLLRAWYTDADPWERDNAYLQQLGTELGLTDEQIDTMFKEASKL